MTLRWDGGVFENEEERREAEQRAEAEWHDSMDAEAKAAAREMAGVIRQSLGLLAEEFYSSYRRSRLLHPNLTPAQLSIAYGDQVEELEERFKAETI